MSPFSFFGGVLFFWFWVLVCLVLVLMVFFLFWFWFGGLSCVNFVCFFQCFGLLFRFWFRFGSLMSLSLSVLSFGFGLVRFSWFFGGVTIYTHQLLHRISEGIKKSHRMPPKSYRANDKAMEISRQEEEFGSQNFSRWWRKRTGKGRAESEEAFLGEQTSTPLVVAGEIHGDVWGCFLFGKIKVSDGFLGTIAMVCFQSYFQLRCLLGGNYTLSH